MTPTDEQTIITEAARRHGFSEAATRDLWRAMCAGRGLQAQFSHPDLGGLGQWSGGMLQIGDMFNSGLKARVLELCADLASPAAEAARAGHGSAPEREAGRASRDWWPAAWGSPSSTGAQNDTRYAMFPDARRLAVDERGHLALYDTGDHRIFGFAQAQGSGTSMTFTSQHGAIRLDDLRRLDAAGSPAPLSRPPARTIIAGGCFCGAVRYEASGTPFHETLCHCTDCRRAFGAAAVAWFTVFRADFRLTAGEPQRFRSSGRATRSFCPTCGTSLFFEADGIAEEIDIATATLDDPDAVPPKDHVHAASCVAWDRFDDGLPIRPEP